MDSHVKILAVLFLVFGAMMIVGGLLLFGVIAGAGAISGEREAMLVTGIVGTVIGAVFMILGLPSVIAGVGLYKRREWGRILAIVVGALNLLNFPFGTALGGYALWVLLSPETQPLFHQRAVATT